MSRFMATSTASHCRFRRRCHNPAAHKALSEKSLSGRVNGSMANPEVLLNFSFAIPRPPKELKALLAICSSGSDDGIIKIFIAPQWRVLAPHSNCPLRRTSAAKFNLHCATNAANCQRMPKATTLRQKR